MRQFPWGRITKVLMYCLIRVVVRLSLPPQTTNRTCCRRSKTGIYTMCVANTDKAR